MTTEMKTAESAGSVSNQVTYTFHVSLYEQYNKCTIGWSTSFPVHLKLGVWLREGVGGPVVAGLWCPANSGSWDTGKAWGTNWSATLMYDNTELVSTPATS